MKNCFVSVKRQKLSEDVCDKITSYGDINKMIRDNLMLGLLDIEKIIKGHLKVKDEKIAKLNEKIAAMEQTHKQNIDNLETLHKQKEDIFVDKVKSFQSGLRKQLSERQKVFDENKQLLEENQKLKESKSKCDECDNKTKELINQQKQFTQRDEEHIKQIDDLKKSSDESETQLKTYIEELQKSKEDNEKRLKEHIFKRQNKLKEFKNILMERDSEIEMLKEDKIGDSVAKGKEPSDWEDEIASLENRIEILEEENRVLQLKCDEQENSNISEKKIEEPLAETKPEYSSTDEESLHKADQNLSNLLDIINTATKQFTLPEQKENVVDKLKTPYHQSAAETAKKRNRS